MQDFTLQSIKNTASAAGPLKNAGNPQGEGFGEILKKSIDGVNANIAAAEEMSAGLVSGRHANIHEAMISMEKADISLRLLTKVQNKVIAAYQEIMRMQL